MPGSRFSLQRQMVNKLVNNAKTLPINTSASPITANALRIDYRPFDYMVSGWFPTATAPRTGQNESTVFPLQRGPGQQWPGSFCFTFRFWPRSSPQ